MAARATKKRRPKSTPRKSPKYKTFGFRLYVDEYAAVKRAAREAGLAPSWFAKVVLLKKIGVKPTEVRNVTHKARRAVR